MARIFVKRPRDWMNESEWLNVFHSIIPDNLDPACPVYDISSLKMTLAFRVK